MKMPSVEEILFLGEFTSGEKAKKSPPNLLYAIVPFKLPAHQSMCKDVRKRLKKVLRRSPV
jgi:hypothetical protein